MGIVAYPPEVMTPGHARKVKTNSRPLNTTKFRNEKNEEVKERMKIKISYLPEEEKAAAADLAALQLRHPDAKVRKSDRHPPYRQIYLSINSKHDSCKVPKSAV